MTLVAETAFPMGGTRISVVMQDPRGVDRDISRRLRWEEIRLLATLASGAPLPVVADRLGLSERTVRRHVRNLCDELGVRTSIEAVVWAARRRLI